MGSTLSVSAARAERWTEVLEMLDAVEAIYGDDPLDDAAWQSLRPLVDVLDASLPNDADAVRAAASRAIAAAEAAARQQPADRPAAEYGLWGGAMSEPTTVPAFAATGEDVTDDTAEVADAPAAEVAPEAVEAPEVEDLLQEAVEAPETEATRQEAATADPEPAPEPSRADGSDMRWSDIAHAVLLRTGRPMTAKQIHAESVANGPTRPTSAKTPERTINRDLNQAIKSGDGRFARGPDRGTFVAASDDA